MHAPKQIFYNQPHPSDPHPLHLKVSPLVRAGCGESHHGYSIWRDHRLRALSPVSTIPARLRWAENDRFLEQFRYTIIASQLLSHVLDPGLYKRRNSSQTRNTRISDVDNDAQTVAFSWTGIALTALAAFALAWSVHWTREVAQSTSQRWPLVLTPIVAVTICAILYLYLRRQWLHWLRDQAVKAASTLVAEAQELDAVVSASINLIREVELISRGYRISTPLPPVTRMEEKSQTRRCAQLRRALQRILSSLPAFYHRAFEELKPLAVEVDLEKYLDIYEISRSEVLECENFRDADRLGTEGDTLKAYKAGLQKLHLSRKLFLCCLLALGADGGKFDLARWSSAARIMDNLSVDTEKASQDINQILGAGEATPSMRLSPGRDRMRSQTRKLNSLSQGIRGLQARLHLLYEDADKLGGNLIHPTATLTAHYDSIGTELKDLLEEWQEGRTAFSSAAEQSNTRLSLPIMPRTAPSSPTMSLGGSTVVEESPPDALNALNGYGTCHRATSSTATSSAGEEVFEAIALPRQKSTLSREERLAKMKEDRIRQAVTRSKNEASSHMLRELETVIKLRPRGRTTGRISSV
ncbi:MAG: hypothetical protein Q9223_000095 [Gallowayella weberi]